MSTNFLFSNVCWQCPAMFVDNAQQCLPLHLKQTFLSKIWIFTEGEGHGIKTGLPWKSFRFSSLEISLTIWLIIQDLLEDHQVQWDLPEDHLLDLQGVVMDLLPFLIRLPIHQCLRTECHQMRTSCQLLIHPLLQLPYHQVTLLYNIKFYKTSTT